jgi:predicted Zn-dependent peptidase
MERMEQTTRVETLPNGLTVAVEEMPHLRSVSLGVWLRGGSRHEPEHLAGVTHFIEHMLFKGSESLSCQEIAERIDLLGGNVDAYTSREKTSYIAKVRDAQFVDAIELLAEMILRPAFSADDIAMEREVVLEELSMVQDTPDDLVHEVFGQALYGGHPLGRSILGTPETVRGFTRDNVSDFFLERYRADRLLISAAGNVRAEQVIAQAERLFGALPRATGALPVESPLPLPSSQLLDRDTLEQVQLLIGVPTFPVTDARRMVLEVLSSYLGGSVSSRLFQNVRERLGLAYAVNSFHTSYSDSGYLAVYAATGADRFAQLVDVLRAELEAVAAGDFQPGDVERVKSMLETEIVLGMESSSSRMSLLAKQLIYFGRVLPIAEILAEVERVSYGDVVTLAGALLTGTPLAACAVGRLNGHRLNLGSLS